MTRIACLVLLASAPLAAAETFVLRGGTVHTVSGPDIPNGSVVVSDGRIVEAGARVAIPRGARVIDIPGLHVYPGLIDSATEMGLTEISAVRETNDDSEIGEFNPQLRAIIAVNPASEHIAVTRANGITTVVTAPSGGVLSGRAALIHLDGWTWEEMQVRPAVSMQLQFPLIETRTPRGFGVPAGRRPFSEAKKDYERRLRQLHEFFEQARRYQKAKAAPAPGFETDLKLEALLPVLEGRLPLVIYAERERAIREAIRFAEEEKLRVVISGAMQAYRLAAELKAKNIPLILGPALALPLEEDDPYDQCFTAPAELHRAGVKFAFGTFSAAFSRNLPYQAAAAVAFGLPYSEGLRALTLNAAEIWGVGQELGSIEKGKRADLIVTDGDPLETRTQVLRVFIQGREVSLENKHRRLYEQYLKRK
jgi:imidazolonepropionase-like amidohydrolase